MSSCISHRCSFVVIGPVSIGHLPLLRFFSSQLCLVSYQIKDCISHILNLLFLLSSLSFSILELLWELFVVTLKSWTCTLIWLQRRFRLFWLSRLWRLRITRLRHLLYELFLLINKRLRIELRLIWIPMNVLLDEGLLGKHHLAFVFIEQAA